jgi:hypothetical protein
MPAARVNAAQLAHWLAAGAADPADIQDAISGAAMQDYARFESLEIEADAASGSPDAPETVTAAGGGYQLCAPDDSGGQTCDALTGFRASAAGRITDLEVNGQLVSPRLAAGTSSTGAGLALSDVLAYRLGATGQVVITYRARNITSHVIGEVTPAFLAVFDPDGAGQSQEDDSTSITPGVLQPGETVIAYASFAAPAITGQFSLRPNGGGPAILAASTLRAVAAPAPANTLSAPPGAATIRLGCKLLTTSTGEEFSVTTVDAPSYSGAVDVSFAGPQGSGQTFPATTINGATTVGAWRPVPADDIGASAEPLTCTAAPG